MNRLLARIGLIGMALLVSLHSVAETHNIQMLDLSIPEGLSHQSVTCFCQDEFGFIWIGTQDGLNRFDGREVEQFKPEQEAPYSITANNIRQLYSNQNGYIYLSSYSCIERYDQRLKRFELLYHGNVQAMACDSAGLYFAERGLICYFDYPEPGQAPDLQTFFSFEEGHHKPIVSHMVRTKRGLVVSAGKQGIFELVDGEITHREPISNIYALQYDDLGYLWVSTRDNGFWRFDEAWNGTHYLLEGDERMMSYNNTRSVIHCGEGRYYVGTFGGLLQLDSNTGAFTFYNYKQTNEVSMQSILTMLYDRKGILWAGTFHNGVQYCYTDNDTYRFYPIDAVCPDLNDSPILSVVVEDRNHDLWLGTEGNGLIRFSPDEQRFVRFSGIAKDEVIKSMHYDASENRLWAATLFHGVMAIDLETGRTQQVSPRILDVFTGEYVGKLFNPMRIIDDRNGNLLIASRNGLVRLDRHQMRLEAIDNEALFRHDVSQVWDIVYAGDNLWMSTSFDLIRFAPRTGKVAHYTFSDLLGSNAEQYSKLLVVDRDENLWVGSTGSGVFRYLPDEDRFTQIGRDEGLPNGFINSIASPKHADEEQTPLLYVAHSHGVSWITKDMRVENYSFERHFPLSYVNENGLFLNSANHIICCGPQGIIEFHPHQLGQRQTDYRIFIKDILVDNRPVMPLDSLNLMERSSLYEQELVLPSRHSSVTFCIADNNYHTPLTTELEYCLKGFDADFRKLENSTQITYMNLKPGSYRFVVRGVRNNTILTSPETSFELRVRAPLYGRRWFQLLVALITLAIIIKLMKARMHRRELEQQLRLEQIEKEHIEQANQQKLRFFTNISHEFRMPITLITGQVELLLARQDIKPSVYNMVLNIYRNTQRLKHMVDEIIDIRRLEQSRLKLQVKLDNLTDMSRAIYLAFHDYAAQHGIEFHFTAPDEPIEAEFDRRQIERVLNNLLSNAFKYTREGRVSLSLSVEGEQAVIAVSDTGIGIASEHLDRIFERFWQEEKANASIEQYGSGIGLSLAKNLIEMHDGRIEVESCPGHGTTFYVRLPLRMRRNNEQVLFLDPKREPTIEYTPLTTLPLRTEHKPQSAHILVVDDNTEMQDILRQLFEPYYRLSFASNGQDGVEMARKEQPDLVLSDIMMPVMSGIELCKQLKTDMETSHIPVVLLTAYHSEEHTVEGLLTGADDYVAKPFNGRILLARCNNIITQRRRLQAKFRDTGDETTQLQLVHNPHDQKLFNDAMAIIEQHLSDSEFSIADFASELGLSRTLLFTKLKGITGQTPNEFILSVRLNRAMQCIKREPTTSIAEIAYDMGFSSPSYFIRCFRTRFGITPNNYRKQQKGGA